MENRHIRMQKAMLYDIEIEANSITLYVFCPFCGFIHTHGGGYSKNEMRVNLGHRVSHCDYSGNRKLTREQKNLKMKSMDVNKDGFRDYYIIDINQICGRYNIAVDYNT